MAAWGETAIEFRKGNANMAAREKGGRATGLTEQVKVRVDRATKAALAVECKRQDRSEGAIVRTALRDYFARQARSKGASQ